MPAAAAVFFPHLPAAAAVSLPTPLHPCPALRRTSVEEPILVSTVSNSSEIELSDGQSLGSLDGEAQLLLGASPRRGLTFSRHPGFATIEEGEEGLFGSTKADSRAASPREVCGQGLSTMGMRFCIVRAA